MDLDFQLTPQRNEIRNTLNSSHPAGLAKPPGGVFPCVLFQDNALRKAEEAGTQYWGQVGGVERKERTYRFLAIAAKR